MTCARTLGGGRPRVGPRPPFFAHPRRAPATLDGGPRVWARATGVRARTRRAASRALAALVALAACHVLLPVARAYERTTVDGRPEAPLAWPIRSILVEVEDASVPGLPAAAVHAALGRSLVTWSFATREGEGTPCTDLSFYDRGDAIAGRTNLMGGSPDDRNRLVFRADAWPSDLGPETLAITTLVYRRSTGEILDADIDLNAVDHAWSTEDAPPEGATDLENTLTHELGHFLGFSHVADPDATMFGQSDPGDVAKRTLAADDVAAVCDVYPLGGRTPGGRLPRADLGSSCDASAPGGGSAPALALALAALVLRLRAPITRAERRSRSLSHRPIVVRARPGPACARLLGSMRDPLEIDRSVDVTGALSRRGAARARRAGPPA